MTNSIIKIEALKKAISRTKHGVTRINDVVRDVNAVWTEAGEPYPLPVGEYKRRAWLLADLERMLSQLVDEAHAEALIVNRVWDGRNATTKVERLSAETGFPVAECLSELEAEEDDYFAARARLRSFVEEAHAEAQEENKRFDWLASRYAMFWGGCDNAQRDEIVAIAWEQARHIIEAEEECKSQKQWKLDAIWKHTHRDYKGECDGVRSILICRNGTTSVPLENLTDAEIEQRSYCWK